MLVELTADGVPINDLINKQSYSSNFSSIESINNFKNRANAEAKKNNGIFVPTYLSSNDYIDRNNPPAFIRIETTP